jgi:hypothetical protein
VLDYTVEPEVECPDKDVNDATFVWGTIAIGGREAVEESVAYGMYPLASRFGFRDVTIGTTAVSKVETPLTVFLVEPVSMEDVGRFLVKVEMDAKKILGSFRPKEYDALVTAKLLNNGHLNRVFEQMGIPYTPCPLHGTEASPVATRKHKPNMSKKIAAKKPKVAQTGKATPTKAVVKRSIVKVTPPEGQAWAERYV